MKTIAYLRVSKDSQDVKNQRLAIQEFASTEKIDIDDFIEVTISSRRSAKERNMILRIVILISLLFFSGGPPMSMAQSEAPITLNVSARDASLREVLRGIAVQHGVSLAGLGVLTGTVTVHLDDVTLEDGLQALLEPQASPMRIATASTTSGGDRPTSRA